ncbi:MAG: hypothetical protein ACRDS0_04685 [Pseudonocardiaceae bacterium]
MGVVDHHDAEVDRGVAAADDPNSDCPLTSFWKVVTKMACSLRNRTSSCRSAVDSPSRAASCRTCAVR